jgi:hypothetical protein
LKKPETPLEKLKRSIQIDFCIKILVSKPSDDIKEWTEGLLKTVVSDEEYADIKKREGF